MVPWQQNLRPETPVEHKYIWMRESYMQFMRWLQSCMTVVVELTMFCDNSQSYLHQLKPHNLLCRVIHERICIIFAGMPRAVASAITT